MKIRFIFHTGKGSDIKNGKWRWLKSKAISTGIIAWTWVLAFVSLQWNRLKYNFSHCEIWFPDEKAGFEKRRDGIDLSQPAGQCFSSTTRGGAKGVRFAPASEVLKHPERWKYIEVEVDKNNLENEKNWAKWLIGETYDYWGLFGFFWPFWNVQNSKKWYCSEICAVVAWHLGLLKKGESRISPRRFAKILAKKYHDPKPLKADK